MSYAEEIIKLRKRMQDAVSHGIVQENNKGFLEAMLIQIMNDAEKNRQNCAAQAENLRRLASVMDGQAGAFSSVISIVYGVLNGYVSLAEKDKQESLEKEKESSTEEKLEEKKPRSKK